MKRGELGIDISANIIIFTALIILVTVMISLMIPELTPNHRENYFKYAEKDNNPPDSKVVYKVRMRSPFGNQYVKLYLGIYNFQGSVKSVSELKHSYELSPLELYRVEGYEVECEENNRGLKICKLANVEEHYGFDLTAFNAALKKRDDIEIKFKGIKNFLEFKCNNYRIEMKYDQFFDNVSKFYEYSDDIDTKFIHEICYEKKTGIPLKMNLSMVEPGKEIQEIFVDEVILLRFDTTSEDIEIPASFSIEKIAADKDKLVLAILPFKDLSVITITPRRTSYQEGNGDSKELFSFFEPFEMEKFVVNIDWSTISNRYIEICHEDYCILEFLDYKSNVFCEEHFSDESSCNEKIECTWKNPDCIAFSCDKLRRSECKSQISCKWTDGYSTSYCRKKKCSDIKIKADCTEISGQRCKWLGSRCIEDYSKPTTPPDPCNNYYFKYNCNIDKNCIYRNNKCIKYNEPCKGIGNTCDYNFECCSGFCLEENNDIKCVEHIPMDSKCEDSDAGEDIYEKGTVLSEFNVHNYNKSRDAAYYRRASDYCFESNSSIYPTDLFEYSCNMLDVFQGVRKYCDDACIDGACADNVIGYCGNNALTYTNCQSCCKEHGGKGSGFVINAECGCSYNNASCEYKFDGINDYVEYNGEDYYDFCADEDHIISYKCYENYGFHSKQKKCKCSEGKCVEFFTDSANWCSSNRTDWQDNCNFNKAGELKKITYCEEITNNIMRLSCISDVLQLTKKSDDCNLLKKEKDNCFKIAGKINSLN